MRWKKPSNITVNDISNDICKYIDYPYLKYTTTTEKLKELFITLQKSELNNFVKDYDISGQDIKLNHKERLILKKGFITGFKYEILMQYFQEHVQNKCNREGKPSPWDTYIIPKYNKKWLKIL